MAQRPPSYKASFVTLLAIVGFSIGLLCGYYFLGNPKTEEDLRRVSREEMANLQGVTRRKFVPGGDEEDAFVTGSNRVQVATQSGSSKPEKSTKPDPKGKPRGDAIHTLFTSNGSPYQNIQARIMVGTYKLVQKMPGGEKLVALTRILHRTKPDEMMDEIPTFRADPVQPECDKWCWFPVADRANAVQQWINAVEKDPSMVKAGWLLMLETDYVWVKPIPVPGDAWDSTVPGQSFAFDYIGSQNPVAKQLLKERCPECPQDSVPNSGPAPVLMRFNDLKLATPIWENLTMWIETHEDAKKMLGWVREMYAWDIAVAVHRLNIQNLPPPKTTLISQPPHDLGLYNASMYHYTWGIIYKEADKEIWKFDKRFYTEYKDQLKVPKLPMPPEWHTGIKLQDGLPVSKALHDTVVDMLRQMNAAIETLPEIKPNV